MSRPSNLRSACEFLLPIKSRVVHAHDSETSCAGRWLIVCGALIGLAYALIYWAVWTVYGEYMQIRVLPCVAVVVAELAFGGYVMLRSVGRIADGLPDRSDGGITLPMLAVVVAVVMLKLAILIVWPRGYEGPHPMGWRTWPVVAMFYVGPVYRPLLLMPIWAAWSALLAMRVGRSSPDCSPRLKAMAAGVRLRSVVGQWVLLTALTMIYSGATDQHLPLGIVVSLAVMLATYIAAFILARRFNGQNEATVLASAMVGQFAFLLTMLPTTSAIYHY